MLDYSNVMNVVPLWYTQNVAPNAFSNAAKAMLRE